MIRAKMFTTGVHRALSGQDQWSLSAVCRGDENAGWAQATPVGTLTVLNNETLAALHTEAVAAGVTALEVFVDLDNVPEGDWVLAGIRFRDYDRGADVEFHRREQDGRRTDWTSELKLSVNASTATARLREAFAESLASGVPSRWSVTVTACHPDV